MTEFSDAKIKHLTMIQTAIERMAAESARMKQFCLASIAALASTATATGAWGLALLAALLTLVFWNLDAKYLSQERWFRALYDYTREADAPADFIMVPDKSIREQHTLSDAMLGWSVAILYGALIVINICICVAIQISAD